MRALLVVGEAENGAAQERPYTFKSWACAEASAIGLQFQVLD